MLAQFQRSNANFWRQLKYRILSPVVRSWQVWITFKIVCRKYYKTIYKLVKNPNFKVHIIGKLPFPLEMSACETFEYKNKSNALLCFSTAQDYKSCYRQGSAQNIVHRTLNSVHIFMYIDFTPNVHHCSAGRSLVKGKFPNHALNH